MDDPAVSAHTLSSLRRAINLVLDKAALVEAVSESAGSVRAGWVLPTDPYFEECWEKVKEQPG